MYIYISVSVYWALCVLCVFVCVISNQSTSKKTHELGLSKLTLNAPQAPCVTKVPRLGMCRSLCGIPLVP